MHLQEGEEKKISKSVATAFGGTRQATDALVMSTVFPELVNLLKNYFANNPPKIVIPLINAWEHMREFSHEMIRKYNANPEQYANSLVASLMETRVYLYLFTSFSLLILK